MNNLSYIVDCIFKNRQLYKSLSIKDKETNFFIINRFLSKKYPDVSNKLNLKSIDKSLALDLWFLKLKNEKGYMKWFWGTPKKLENSVLKNSDIKILIEHLNLKDETDVVCLFTYFRDELTEELDYIKKVNP